jgi:hypothetical protein
MGGDLTEDVTSRLRGYHWWRGVGSTGWYLWRRKTSPPKIQRFATREDLLDEIGHRVAEQDRWDRGHNLDSGPRPGSRPEPGT